MLGRHKLLILTLAVLLIPVLLGTTPMNLVQRLSSPLPQSLDKQIKRCGSCLFNSIAVQYDLSIAGLNSALLEWKSRDPIQINLGDLVGSRIPLAAAILRC